MAPEAALFAGTVTPLLAARIADSWSERLAALTDVG